MFVNIVRGSKPWLFDAYFGGEKIVTGSKQAEFAACRVLQSRGLSGEVLIGMGKPSFRTTVERGAVLATSEPANSGPRIVKYHPIEIEAAD